MRFSDKSILEKLACPDCRGDISYKSDRLMCNKCGREYKLIDGIPCLLPSNFIFSKKLRAENNHYKEKKSFKKGHYFAHKQARLPIEDALVNLGCTKASAILNVGIGTGVEIEFIERVSKNIVGVDISLEALKIFMAKFKYPVFRADVLTLPFRDESFDCLIISGLIHHLAGYNDLRKYMREFKRVLVRGGVIVVVEPNIFYPVATIMFLLDSVVQKIRPGWRGHVPHERPISPFFLKRELQRTGFSETEYKSCTYLHNKFPYSLSKFIVSKERNITNKRLFKLFGWWFITTARNT